MLWSLLLLATLALSRAERVAERHQVVVVGAGVSGFTAAATLLEHNVTDLVILEASDRIGGRIHTVKFGGVTIDKGAEYVHGEVDNSVYEMVSPYDLLVSYLPYFKSEYILFANTSGHVFNSTFLKELVDEVYAILREEGIQHFKGSMAEYFNPRADEIFRSKHVDKQLDESVRRLVEQWEGLSSAADNLTDQGSWGQSQNFENEGDLNLKWKNGTEGYKIIFDLLSKKIPNPSEELPVVNKTKLNKEVTKIEIKENYVEVTCADGSSYTADHVIVTVSLGVLKKHAATMFHPALPSVNTAAIKNLGYGCVSKVFLLFPTRWWPNNTDVFVPLVSQQELQHFRESSKNGWWSSDNTGYYPVVNHKRMLSVWFYGNSSWALDQLPDETVTEGVMELMDKMLGDKFDIPRPEAILRTDWGSNPYTLGTYSFRSVDSDRLNITNDDLAKAVLHGDKPVIQFAGEATHLHYFSTVHGALDAGRREAQNLINYLKSKSSS